MVSLVLSNFSSDLHWLSNHYPKTQLFPWCPAGGWRHEGAVNCGCVPGTYQVSVLAMMMLGNVAYFLVWLVPVTVKFIKSRMQNVHVKMCTWWSKYAVYRAASEKLPWDVLIFSQQWPITSCISHKEHKPGASCNLFPNMTSWTVHGIWWVHYLVLHS